MVHLDRMDSSNTVYVHVYWYLGTSHYDPSVRMVHLDGTAAVMQVYIGM